METLQRPSIQIISVNTFTPEEIDSALDESKYNVRGLGKVAINFPDSGTTVYVERGVFSSRDVDVHMALCDPTSLNFVETEDGLQFAPRLHQ